MKSCRVYTILKLHNVLKFLLHQLFYFNKIKTLEKQRENVKVHFPLNFIGRKDLHLT